jgi:predicted TIM-barrel fold metal-dependent hydrolase
MDEALARAQDLLSRWDEEVARILPADTRIFDAHVHLGNDIDGMVGVLDELLKIQERYRIDRAFMFCLDEPDRHPAFRAGNDRTLEFAQRSEGRLVPFVRLDLSESPIEEAVRCLDRGARGIKLHPRAQGFLLNDERLAPVFALAAERRVPILIHGGRGLPPIADHLGRLVEANPEAQLIIAHAGIADLAALARTFAGTAGVFFDTSVWSPVDLLDFYRQVPPEQILYASDYPYGRQPNSLLIALRTARIAGLSEDDVGGMLWGNANRIAEGEAPREPTRPQGSDTLTQTMQLARVHQYLSMATTLLWSRQQDTGGVLGLALNACQEQDGHVEVGQIRDLLETARELWRELPELEEQDRPPRFRSVNGLIHLADVLAVTAGA